VFKFKLLKFHFIHSRVKNERFVVIHKKVYLITIRSDKINMNGGNITAHCFPTFTPSRTRTFQVWVQTLKKVPYLLFLINLLMDFSYPPSKYEKCCWNWLPEWHNAQTEHFLRQTEEDSESESGSQETQSCLILLHDLGQITQLPCCSINVSSNEHLCYTRM